MTRTDDRDYLTPADSTLRSDLAERSRLANAFASRPVRLDPSQRRRPRRPRHQRDADLLQGSATRALRSTPPRTCTVTWSATSGSRTSASCRATTSCCATASLPPLLTESSYITNPDVESKLALASKQRLEAEALLLGLGRYFARARHGDHRAGRVLGRHQARTPDTLTTWGRRADGRGDDPRALTDHPSRSRSIRRPSRCVTAPAPPAMRWSPEDGPLAPGDHVVSVHTAARGRRHGADARHRDPRRTAGPRDSREPVPSSRAAGGRRHRLRISS